MQPPYHIQFLKRQDIDAARWDNCIASSANRLIYGYSYYLDGMTDGQWDALVLGGYEAVMPLPWRSKAGVRYVYQPAFTQQGGVFAPQSVFSGFSVQAAPPGSSHQAIPPALVEAFLTQLCLHFRFAEIFLNYANPLPSLPTNTNLILPLDKSYEPIAAGYKPTLVRHLAAASKEGMNYHREFDLTTILHAYQEEYSKKIPSLKKEDYRRFGDLCRTLLTSDRLIVRAVTGAQRQLLAAALLPKDDARLYLVHTTTLSAGRTVQANHFLLDQLIREWATTGYTLDFEGSDLPGVSRFYRNFGCIEQPFFFYRHNRLPWPVRLLKKR